MTQKVTLNKQKLSAFKQLLLKTLNKGVQRITITLYWTLPVFKKNYQILIVTFSMDMSYSHTEMEPLQKFPECFLIPELF